MDLFLPRGKIKVMALPSTVRRSVTISSGDPAQNRTWSSSAPMHGEYRPQAKRRMTPRSVGSLPGPRPVPLSDPCPYLSPEQVDRGIEALIVFEPFVARDLRLWRLGSLT